MYKRQAQGHGEAAGALDGFLGLLGGALGEPACDLLDRGVRRQAQRAEQPGPVVRIVGVRAHPPVGRAPEPRQRCEDDRRPAVGLQEPLAVEGGGDRAVVDPDAGHLGEPGPVGREFRGGQRARADTRPGELPYGKARRERAFPRDGGEPCERGGIAAQCGPRVLDCSHDCTMQY